MGKLQEEEEYVCTDVPSNERGQLQLLCALKSIYDKCSKEQKVHYQAEQYVLYFSVIISPLKATSAPIGACKGNFRPFRKS